MEIVRFQSSVHGCRDIPRVGASGLMLSRAYSEAQAHTTEGSVRAPRVAGIRQDAALRIGHRLLAEERCAEMMDPCRKKLSSFAEFFLHSCFFFKRGKTIFRIFAMFAEFLIFRDVLEGEWVRNVEVEEATEVSLSY